MASLQRYQVPEWYQDAKFGVFLHWGLFSVPAYESEWYARFMYEPYAEVESQGRDFIYGTINAHHVKISGPPDTFGYKDFIPRFRPDRYDPQAWAQLAHDAAARYPVPVAEFHDGFPRYDSSHTNWNAVKIGPRRDLYAELAAAASAQRDLNSACHRTAPIIGDFYVQSWPRHDGPRQHRHYGPPRDPKAPPTLAFVNDEFGRSVELIKLSVPTCSGLTTASSSPATRIAGASSRPISMTKRPSAIPMGSF